MNDIFKRLPISEYERNVFNGDYSDVYLLYCVAINQNKLLSVANGSIFVLNNVNLTPQSNYILKLRISTLGDTNLYIVNKDEFILVECMGDLKLVKVNRVDENKRLIINELNCYALNCGDLAYNVANIVVPAELELLATEGTFLYSYEYDKYLSEL